MSEKEMVQNSSENYVSPEAEVIRFRTQDVIFESEDNDVAFGA